MSRAKEQAAADMARLREAHTFELSQHSERLRLEMAALQQALQANVAQHKAQDDAEARRGIIDVLMSQLN